MSTEGALVSVLLPSFPVRTHVRAQQHSEGMRRELYLVHAQAQLHPGSVPGRLLSLAAALTSRYAGSMDARERRIEQALQDGEEQIDLEIRLPADVGPAVEQMEAMLDEADAWCRAGGLLSLATPADLVEYRRWYLGNVRTQVNGGPPRPWTGAVR